MPIKRVYELAYGMALTIWVKEQGKLNEDPDNEILIERERRAWDEAQLIWQTIRMIEEAEKSTK